jgi:DNA-directed RNA polymerase sigma subunit (sigma70/sigma32)
MDMSDMQKRAKEAQRVFHLYEKRESEMKRTGGDGGILHTNAPNQGICLSLAERIELAEQAHSGDREARERLILAFGRYCNSLACRYSQRYAHTSYRAEKDDLFQLAMLTVIEVLDQALEQHLDPFPYILVAVRRELVEHCLWRIHLIVPPQTRNRDGGARYQPYSMKRVEEVVEKVSSAQQEQTYPALYRAIERLQGRYRLVIEMRFGLSGHAPTSLPMINQTLTQGKGTSWIASAYQVKALRKLRQLLCDESAVLFSRRLRK